MPRISGESDGGDNPKKERLEDPSGGRGHGLAEKSLSEKDGKYTGVAGSRADHDGDPRAHGTPAAREECYEGDPLHGVETDEVGDAQVAVLSAPAQAGEAGSSVGSSNTVRTRARQAS